MTGTASHDRELNPDPTMMLRQEQVRIGTEWVATGRVRISRRVVTETRTVEVTVHREELIVETDTAVGTDGAMVGTVLDGAAVAPPAGPPEPLIVVLREEQPEVVMRVRPYERVTVHVDLAGSEERVDSQVRTETVDYAVEPTR